MRRYIQFNNLVFDGDVVSKEFPDVNFKYTSTESTFTHGSSILFNGLIKPSKLNINIIYDLKIIPCEYRKFFKSFIVEELSKKGKLWAIDEESDRLLYANAIVESYDETPESYKHNRLHHNLDLNISFNLYEGVWHIADTTTTFMKDWSICSFMECKGYREILECDNCYTGSINLCEEGCCDCENVTCENSLCNIELSTVDKNYLVIQDEVLGRRLNGKKALGYGLELMKPGEYLKSENLYVPTDLPCLCDIYINGFFDTPYITVNGNENYFDLTSTDDKESRMIGIKCNGDIVEIVDCEETILSIEKWNVPSGQSFGFELKPLYNNIAINRGLTEGAFEVFVKPHSLTM